MTLLLPSVRRAASSIVSSSAKRFSPAAATTTRVKSTRAFEFPGAAVSTATAQEDHPWKITCHFGNSSESNSNSATDKPSLSSGPAWDASMIPAYLHETYWWAYLHPVALKVFERQWLVDQILWGNYQFLRDEAQKEVESCRALVSHNHQHHHPEAKDAGANTTSTTTGLNILRVACVYGDFDENLLHEHLKPEDHLHIIDVAPQQLENTLTKLMQTTTITSTASSATTADAATSSTSNLSRQVHLWQQNSSALTSFDHNSMDCVLIFFLLHEMPLEVREKTLQEAIRVLKPETGRLVIVDYHKIASRWNPLYYVMKVILSTLEPFALDLWRTPLQQWLKPSPDDHQTKNVHVLQHQFYAGGLYQKLVAQKENILPTTSAPSSASVSASAR